MPKYKQQNDTSVVTFAQSFTHNINKSVFLLKVNLFIYFIYVYGLYFKKCFSDLLWHVFEEVGHIFCLFVGMFVCLFVLLCRVLRSRDDI